MDKRKIRSAFEVAIRQNVLNALSGPNATRRPARSERFHQSLAEIVHEIGGDGLSVETEYKLFNDLFGKDFDVDIYVSGGRLKEPVLILVKVCISNYNKNRFNYAEGKIGQTARALVDITADFRNVRLVNLDFIPRRVPVFDKEGNIKKVESANVVEITRALQLLFDSRAQSCPVMFDMPNSVYEAGSREGMFNALRESNVGVEGVEFEPAVRVLHSILGDELGKKGRHIKV